MPKFIAVQLEDEVCRVSLGPDATPRVHHEWPPKSGQWAEYSIMCEPYYQALGKVIQLGLDLGFGEDGDDVAELGPIFFGDIETKWGKGRVECTGLYEDGTAAIEVTGYDGTAICKLTVCVTGHRAELGRSLQPGEYIVKTWEENKATAQACLDAGLFTDTGLRLKCGFVEAQVWKAVNPGGQQ